MVRGSNPMMRRLSILVTLVTVSGLTLAASSLGSDIQTDGALTEPGLHVDPQITDGANVTVSRVNANESLWVVIHADENGTFGEVLGNSELLDEGLQVGVDIEVDLQAAMGDNQTVRLHAMLHHDDGDGEYEFPDSDQPMTDEGGDIIVHPFNVSVEDKQAVVANGIAEFEEDEDDGGVLDLDDTEITVELARLAQDGYVVLHRDDAGKPGQVVGQTDLLEAGEHEDVDIQVNQTLFSVDGASATLWAMIHFDDGDGVYVFPGPDQPVTVGDTPVMTPFPVQAEDEDGANETDQPDVGEGETEEPGDGQDTPAPSVAAVTVAALGAAFLMRRARR